jgi:GTP-binding protein Era
MGLSRGRGAVAVLLAAALWGSTGTAAAFAPGGVSPLSVGAARIVVGGAALLLAGLTGRGNRESGLRALLLPQRRAWAGLSSISMATYQVTFFSAVATTGVAVGTVVAIGSAPVFTGVVSRLTGGPSLTRRWLLTTAGAIAGATVLITGGRGAGVHPAGVVLGLLAGLSYAVYAVGTARLITGGLPEQVVMGGLFGCAGVLLLPMLAAGPLGWLLTLRGATVALHLGLVTTAVAYLLYARGLRTIPAPAAVTLGLAEPAVAALLAVAVLGEHLSGAAVAGLVLIGLALTVLAAPRSSRGRADVPSLQRKRKDDQRGAGADRQGAAVRENSPVGSPPRPPRAGAARATAAAQGSGPPEAKGFRSGFACFAGRPNVGKSTLMNALVGTKVAITSSRPQTTRRAIRGIVHRPDAQLVIVDTPGLHRPRTLLGERLDSLVRSTLTEVDVIGFCVPAPDRIGPGDKYLAAELARVGQTPVVAIVTKADLATPEQVAAQLAAVAGLGDWADIVPVSATTGFQLDVLADVLVSRLAPGSPLYPEGELTDEPEQVLVAELIREAALEGVHDELPHSIAVVVEEMAPREGRDDLTDVYAQMFVERPSQKSIVIGAKGARLKQVGTQARRQIEALLGTKVYLDLRVKVAKDWQRDPKQLRRLGFYD